MAKSKIRVVTPNNIKSLIKASKKTPILVVFFTEGCDGCAQMRPLVAEFAEQWDGRVGYVEGNFPELEEELRIAFFPAFILYYGGKAVRQSDAISDFDDLVTFTDI